MSEYKQSRGVRELGRELAVISIYMYDANNSLLNDILDFKWYDEIYKFGNEDGNLFYIPLSIKSDIYHFTGQIINGAVGNLARIDTIIKKHLVNWEFDRLHAMDKAILRISIYSLLYQYDVPIEVAISEANELSEKYCEENTSNYINGILHKVKQEFRKNYLSENSTQGKKQIKLKSKIDSDLK